MDDESGWNQILLEVWSTQVRDAVVEHIERSSVGRHGWLVRVFADPDGVSGSLTETVHAVVLAAIRDETGADLDGLGSQAAWECYEQVWTALEGRWRDGGTLSVVPLGAEPSVIAALRQLPDEAAVAAAAEVGQHGVQPLWLRGRLLVDDRGLEAYLAHDGGRVPSPVAQAIRQILAHLP
ncbi:MAG: hypothetical protein LC679_07810 [Intrasporangiaceae bacterium]|nr:hypothetical protein [Intrasporangiaceae bacterium]